MEKEGPTTEHGGGQPGTTNNVVPFPRDWLGPREELIPFGNGAGRAAEQDAVEAGAEAFWGGEAGPVDAVVPAPAPAAAVAAVAAVAGPGFRTIAGRLAVGGLVAAVLIAAVLGRIAGVPSAGSGPAVGSGVAAAGFFDLALLRGAVGAPTIKPSQPTVRHVARHRRRPVVHVVRRHPAASSATTVVAAPATTTAQPVGSTTSSTSEQAATSSAPTHSSVSSHSANVRPGPVGPGAPFGPGQLK